MLTPSESITTLTRTDELAGFCARAMAHPFIALDTEFMRETTYWPKLCLIQAAFPGEEVLIDPLVGGLDLAPLLDLLARPDITKVFHAARQDLEIFVRLMGALPVNVFDTQIGAMAAGYGDSISYENLVGAILDESVDKSSRFTDWARRPLSLAQQAYALADVVHLRALFPKLLDKLRSTGREDWAQEELKSLLNPELYDTSPDRAWKRLRIRRYKTEYLAVLKAVAAWREREAQNRDQPRGRILKDDAIYEIVDRKPRVPEDFSELRATPRGFGASRMGTSLIEAIGEALANPELAAPEIVRPEPPPAFIGPVTELLKVLLKLAAERKGVAPRLIATCEDLDKLAADDEADIPALQGWRREAFGEQALRLKRGEIALTLVGCQIRILQVARVKGGAETLPAESASRANDAETGGRSPAEALTETVQAAGDLPPEA